MVLEALDEPALVLGQAIRATYRLTIIPSFSPASSIRIDRFADSAHLSYRSTMEAGGYNPRTLAVASSETLPITAAEGLERLLDSVGFWKLNDRNVGGLDGEQWIVETYTSKGRRMVMRWSPTSQEDSAFLSIARRFLYLARSTNR